MYITIISVLFFYNLIHIQAYTPCCANTNILVNGTCSDGSNVTSLDCKIKIYMGPDYQPPVQLEFEDEDEELKITEDEEVGYYLIAPDKYCYTRGSENGTHFALVCVEDDLEEAKAGVVFYYIKMCCFYISILFFIGILAVYLFTPGLLDLEGKIIANMIGPLLLAHIVIGLLPLTKLIEPNPCDVTGFLYFTSVLCCDNWLSVVSFHLCRITLRPIFKAHINWFWMYLGYGYGLPLLLLVTALITHFSRDTELTVGDHQCMFDGNMAVWAYSYGPAMIMILISILFQFLAAKKLWFDIDRRDDSSSVIRLRKKSLVYMHLLLVLALVQIIDMTSYVFYSEDESNAKYVWDLLDCRNFLSGGAIFFILVVQRTKVLKALGKNGLFCFKFPEHWKKLKDEESEEVEWDEKELTRESAGV